MLAAAAAAACVAFLFFCSWSRLPPPNRQFANGGFCSPRPTARPPARLLARERARSTLQTGVRSLLPNRRVARSRLFSSFARSRRSLISFRWLAAVTLAVDVRRRAATSATRLHYAAAAAAASTAAGTKLTLILSARASRRPKQNASSFCEFGAGFVSSLCIEACDTPTARGVNIVDWQ